MQKNLLYVTVLCFLIPFVLLELITLFFFFLTNNRQSKSFIPWDWVVWGGLRGMLSTGSIRLDIINTTASYLSLRALRTHVAPLKLVILRSSPSVPPFKPVQQWSPALLLEFYRPQGLAVTLIHHTS